MSCEMGAAAPLRAGGDEPLALWNLPAHLMRLVDQLASAEPDGHFGRKSDPREAGPQAYFETLRAKWRRGAGKHADGWLCEPVWEIMLELMLARIAGRDRRLSDIATLAARERSAAIAYAQALEQAKIIELFDNAAEAGNPFMALSSEAARRMAELFRARMRG